MEKVQELAFRLHDLLLKSDEYKQLKEIEYTLKSDSVSFERLNKYHTLQEKYQFDKTDDVLKELHIAKLALDNNEIVIKYKKAYKDYQLLVGKITDIVFEDFSNPSLLDKIVRAK